MPLRQEFQTARDLGESFSASTVTSLRRRLQHQLRASIGVTKEPPPPCSDPDAAYFSPDSIVRVIHSDFPSMLIGGLASLLFQMLHPLAMAGVAEHSRYRDDPLGRLERTAQFLGTTTFGSRVEAEEAISVVRSVHNFVNGTAADGRPYSANDPGLLTWVHSTEVRSFLSASLAYGPRPLSLEEQDRYIEEMSQVALALGATHVPLSVSELDEYFHTVRPELSFTPEAKEARNFVLLGVRRQPHEVATYATMIGAAQTVLPSWARRQLRLISIPVGDRFGVRPVALALSGAMRWVATPLD
ncbi:MAG: oxygenase MpaB family protein [Actinomycetes bacterium]